MRVGRLAVAGSSETIDLDKIVAGLPNRIHQVADSYVAKFADRVALLEDGASWTYRELDRSVKEIATVLGSLGVRAGDRMIIVSENCIALAALLLAASRIDAWAIVANPRLSPRELDQIRDHSGARRMLFHLQGFEGSCGSRVALRRRKPAAGIAETDRRRSAERRRGR